MNDILSRCTFKPRPNTWYREDSDITVVSVWLFDEQHTFSNGAGLFEGYTDETYTGYSGELPRWDGEMCPLEEFFIYDPDGIEISQLTIKQYIDLKK